MLSSSQSLVGLVLQEHVMDVNINPLLLFRGIIFVSTFPMDGCRDSLYSCLIAIASAPSTIISPGIFNLLAYALGFHDVLGLVCSLARRASFDVWCLTTR